MHLFSHPLPKLWHVCDGVEDAARGQQVGVVCQLRPADDAPPVCASLEMRVLHSPL